MSRLALALDGGEGGRQPMGSGFSASINCWRMIIERKSNATILLPNWVAEHDTERDVMDGRSKISQGKQNPVEQVVTS